MLTWPLNLFPDFLQRTWQIIETVNFASGRWAMRGFDNYQEHLANWRKRWEEVRPDQSEFVPSLNHEIECDGFGRMTQAGAVFRDAPR